MSFDAAEYVVMSWVSITGVLETPDVSFDSISDIVDNVVDVLFDSISNVVDKVDVSFDSSSAVVDEVDGSWESICDVVDKVEVSWYSIFCFCDCVVELSICESNKETID